MSRVFFHVQHLLGIGHIRRAAVLARTLAASGFDVLLVSGGAPLKLDLGRARFHQLPPVRARDDGLRELSRLDGKPLDETFKEQRVRTLLDLFRAEQPDVLITEQFPFGRTQLRFELVPLLKVAREQRPKPLIVSSVRDVVRRSVSPQRVQETLELLRSFDRVLIHGDPKMIGFERSFTAWDAIRDRAAYTGYVADLARAEGAAGKDEVIVSVGGGAVGAPLIEAAAAARAKTALAGRTWRLLGGPGQARTVNGMAVESARSDFPTLLRNATLSISQAGYNTVVEILAYADRAVLVPFGTARETEQTDRATWLAERGLVTCLPAESLAPDTLASAVDRALQRPSIRSLPPCDLNGAATTAALLHQRLT